MPLSALRTAEIIHADESLTVQWLPVRSCLLNTWSGFLQGEAFRSRMNLAVELQARMSATCAIADVQALRPLISADQEWVNEDWTPRIVAAGLRRMAVVQPANVFSQLVISNVVGRLDPAQLEVAQVAQVADALRWLENLTP